MPTVLDILARKGSHVYTVPASATVMQAVTHMNDHKIGAVVVMDGDRVAGIFTERDVLRRVVAVERQPSNVRVSEVMSEQVVCCHSELDVEDAGAIMRDRRIRHLPVCDADGRLIGMVSIGDINAIHSSDQAAQIHFLHDYIYGRA